MVPGPRAPPSCERRFKGRSCFDGTLRTLRWRGAPGTAGRYPAQGQPCSMEILATPTLHGFAVRLVSDTLSRNSSTPHLQASPLRGYAQVSVDSLLGRAGGVMRTITPDVFLLSPWRRPMCRRSWRPRPGTEANTAPHMANTPGVVFRGDWNAFIGDSHEEHVFKTLLHLILCGMLKK